jgi:hypothetical protein
VLIGATVLLILALAMLVFNPAKVLAAVFLLLVIYTNPIPSLLTLAVILPIYFYIKR